jgi:hypothetical protein
MAIFLTILGPGGRFFFLQHGDIKNQILTTKQQQSSMGVCMCVFTASVSLVRGLFTTEKFGFGKHSPANQKLPLPEVLGPTPIFQGFVSFIA